MSELEARKYTSIRNLREEIRQDMQDYKLLHTKAYIYEEENNKMVDDSLFIGWYSGEDNCWNKDGSHAPERAFSDNAEWYKEYLEKKLKQNLLKLKELVEQNNE